MSTSMNCPNYQNLNDTTEAYGDFIQEITVATDKEALDYISIRSCIMRFDIRYISWFSIREKVILKIN